MSETKQLLAGKKAITPLWIVALFVSLTEVVLGVAVIQTTGGIQIALTVFVMTFPVLIAGLFFSILWFKPYVFYPPTEFSNLSVSEYVEAMQRRPALTNQAAGSSGALIQTTEDETKGSAKAAKKNEELGLFKEEIVNQFIKSASLSGLIAFYACSLSHLKSKPFNPQEIFSLTLTTTFDYMFGFMVSANSSGFIRFTSLRGIWSVTAISERMQGGIPTELDARIAKLAADGKTNPAAQALCANALTDKSTIEKYFA